ncbi:AAA family ATPase [Clostridium estertheticum]|uniref:UvrD-helicase domain-containing protein n=1 Tax=Clostridium estertheticum TaxID=238834 RepID=UPI001C0E709B|nr:UvrD-helicase domain-containing protein [Clostridium estertheticum]MBU3217527.1 AAA family ATPase [Clostridium estertheticum]WAG55242.1 AAA family ATPase [Clostridium estertheticum]
MVEARLEPEVEEVFRNINNGDNFLLSGGAGSGKTYSLVQVIKEAIRKNPAANIVCMTYTNAAVKEIEERVNHKNLRVSTIHDFLWDNIKMFQKQLKKSLLVIINDDEYKIKKPNEDCEEIYINEFENGITYKEHLNIKNGEISHDEVLIVANYMYKNYKVLCDILKDKYKFIFIDEYQDTNPLVVQIFLEYLLQSKKKCIVGFFGDSMQSIYDDGIGDLSKYIESNIIQEIKKIQNRRSPQLVINLANNVRTDGLIQIPSSDNNAPNMRNGQAKMGNIKFLYSSNNDLDKLKNTKWFAGWKFEDAKQTKELSLTHNLIAPKAGFGNLMDIYGKDPIIKLKNDVVSKIKKNNMVIEENLTFGQVVSLVQVKNVKKLLKVDLIMDNTEDNKLYEQLKDLPFSIVRKIYFDVDSLIDDKKDDADDQTKSDSKRDDLMKHLFKIQMLVQLYENKRYSEFIRKTKFKIDSIIKKKEIKEIVEIIKSMSMSTIEEVINFADEKRICKKDDKFTDFIEKNEYLYKRVKRIKFLEFQNLYNYLEGHTPFSTQHKIKGAEFDNVLVVLDGGGWNKYNFEYLLDDSIQSTLSKSKQKSYDKILMRTKKIFYVCITRAKENLVVYYNSPSLSIINKAKEWFGEENVLEC